jgi:uncharacterized OsmC-like protein
MTQTLDRTASDQTMSVRYDGGSDEAPTPTELFVASLAGCVAFYAGCYLTRHCLSRECLGVAVTYRTAADQPARVRDVHLAVRVPDLSPLNRRLALQAVVEHCTVHNSLINPPAVGIDLTG